MNDRITALAAAGFFAIMSVVSPANPAQAAQGGTEQLEESQNTVNEAAKVVQQIKSNPQLVRQMAAAKGIFIVPNYGRAALGVGGSGGEGILLVHRNGRWSGPIFYNLGGISAGLEAGVEAGQIAMLLMTEKAIESFMTNNNFSLNADAGLTIIDYSARTQESYGKGDILLWSDTKGAFAGLAINVENIVWDEEETVAYYGDKAAYPATIAKGSVETDRDEVIQEVLP
ncbi:lipid-binding SYLF domain-containing protein [Nitrosococcus wardiae]|uniref:Ysc84 actin-binding domain-containing protein n=1 Tax=Nitrosococcus wardiae TaxID=1814290 RepID=A0A4V1AVR2_9GAMM|nr:lipid-binding SYLF domain-containing protein [Nitrosococcus wardiae]QBQ54025.1 hypothetical protein E3U44_05535 [Nitrosococcus wardiae]